MRIHINCAKWRVFDYLYTLTTLLPWKRGPYTRWIGGWLGSGRPGVCEKFKYISYRADDRVPSVRSALS